FCLLHVYGDQNKCYKRPSKAPSVVPFTLLTHSQPLNEEAMSFDYGIHRVLAYAWLVMASSLLGEHSVSHRSSRFRSEMLGTFVLWVMWLVGAVDTTNRIIPGKNYCPRGKQCRILTTILAFSWIGWSFLTIIGTMGLMYYAYSSGQSARIRDHEKAAEATGNL
ncbi:hypothetical protein EDD18DRAFT_1179756, partial [Armillaria luteobubalina]